MSGLRGSYSNGFAPRDGEPLYPELWRGCVGAWAPCLGPTGLTLRDWSGRANHGTLTNMAGTDCVPSRGRYAFNFDFTDNFVSIPTFRNSSLCGMLSLWIYARTFNANQTYFCYYRAAGGAGTDIFEIEQQDSSGGLRMLIRGASGTIIDANASSVLTANEWVNVRFVMPATGGLQIWKNQQAMSVSYATGSSSTRAWMGDVTNADTCTIGRLIESVPRYPNALIDDLFISSVPTSYPVLSQRRGIAYDLAPRRRSVFLGPSFSAAWARRQSLIIGGGLQ